MGSRFKNPIFWLGLVSTVYTAVIHAGASAGVKMPWWICAIGVGLSTVFLYLTGSEPGSKKK